ncbi:MAG TPA: ATP-binding cassette domain-containing protein [Acidimicrobiales bacterium]|nr:ATP-binding cassette domain-containing protein [Acidimicrobiales bacterium]
MQYFLPFVVIGLTTGSVYALAATGLVLTYKTSRIFNFALGAIATLCVYLFYALVFRVHVPWPLAAVLAVVAIGPALGVAFEVLGHRLTPLSTEAKVLATIGLLLFIDGAVALWGQDAFEGGQPAVLPFLPRRIFAIGGVNVGEDQIIIMVVGLLAAVGLHLMLEYTHLGRAMRGVVENPELLALSGKNPRTVLRASWALGIAFVALAGLLLVLSPSNDISADMLSLLILQAFAAAAIGGFSSLPLAYLGGLAVGIASSLSAKYVTTVTWLSGVPPSIPFLILFLALVIAPRRLVREQPTEIPPTSRRLILVPRWYGLPVAAVTAAALLAIPLTKNIQLLFASNEALAYAVIFLGLSLLIRTSGQVSLCQMGLAGIGAAIFAHLAVTFGLPWLAAVLLGGLAAAAVGAVVAIPAIRVAGIYVAVATFGFGVLLEQLFYPTTLFFGSHLEAPRPDLGPFNSNDDATFYVVLLVMFLLAVGLTTSIRRARLGRLLRALGDSPRALQTQGTAINITKVTVFCISAFLAGIGGCLLMSQERFLDATPFSSTSSLTLVVVLLTLRVAEPYSSLAAAGALIVLPSFLNPTAQIWWLDIGFGAAAVLVAVSSSAAWLPRWRWAPVNRASSSSRRRGWRTPPGRAPEPVGHPAPLEAALADGGGRGLEVQDLTVHYRGVVAVDHLSLSVPMGVITGLIGPNGAGKTTTFDFCSGLVQPVTGRLFLHGTDITALSASSRARHGLGRTFQRADLFSSSSVRQNVELGAEGAMAGAHPLTHLTATPRQVRAVRQAADDAIELVGIQQLAQRDVHTLSTAEKRLVELARCLAGAFDVLLLDEPSAGLDSPATRSFGNVLQRVVRERGVGVLLVEHDMSLVTEVCTRLLVLDFGRLIFSGTPDDATSDAAVRAAYLGVEAAI